MLSILIFLCVTSSILCGTLEEFETCSEINECNLGLKCNSVCVEDTDAPKCFQEHLKARRRIKDKLLGVFRPNCLENGDYGFVQCRGSVCQCTDKYGVEIARYSTHIQTIESKNCKCARNQDEYRKKGLIGKFFICDTLGNFEQVQCLGSVCYCADEDGNQLSASQTVHIQDKDTLKCD